jgi:hypothetical protein
MLGLSSINGWMTIRFKVMFPKEFMRYIVPKGFIAIDGTSLTVCDVHTGDLREDNWFTFMLVEYTQKKIILPFKEVGDTVNIEVDVLSKYSERAWEAFVPKMEALEEKVRELEGRLAEVEGRKAGVVGSATVGDSNYTVKYGDIIPQSPERKNGEVDGDEIDGLVNKDRKTVSSERWVRSEQSFLNKNY